MIIHRIEARVGSKMAGINWRLGWVLAGCLGLLLQGCVGASHYLVLDETKAAPYVSGQVTKGASSQSYLYTLPNGLEVLLWPNKNSHSHDEMSLRLLVHTGSLHEQDHQLGYAHIVEHMLFAQRDETGDNPIEKAFERLQLDLGTHGNAFTGLDSTIYHFDIGNADIAYQKEVLAVMARFAYGSNFDAEEVAQEIDIVKEEYLFSESSEESYAKQSLKYALQGNRHLERLPIGTLDSIEGATSESLETFYRAHYRPENASLIVTGDFDVNAMVTAIHAQFSAWPASGQDRAKRYPRPSLKLDSYKAFTDQNALSNSLTFGYVQEPAHLSNAQAVQDHAVDIVVLALLNERLSRATLKTLGNVRNLFATKESDFTEEAYVSVSFSSEREQVHEAVKLLSAVQTYFLDHGVSEHELNLVRSRMLADERSQQDSANHLASVAERHLSEGLWLRDQQHYLMSIEAALSTLSTGQIQQRAKQLLAKVPSIQVLAREFDQIPSETEIRKWLHEGQRIAAAPDADVALLGVPETTQDENGVSPASLVINASPGSIVAETHFDNGVHLLELSNGIKVHYAYSDSTPEKFDMSLSAQGGSLSLSEREIIAMRVGLPVVSESGVQRLSRDQKNDYASKWGIDMSSYITPTTRGIYASGRQDSGEQLMRLLHAALQSCRVDADVLAYFQTQLVDETNQFQRLSYAKALEQKTDFIGDGSVMYRNLTQEEINSVDTVQLQTLCRERFSGSQDYVVNIAGDIELSTLRPWLAQYVASLPTKVAKQDSKKSYQWQGAETFTGKDPNRNATGMDYGLQVATADDSVYAMMVQDTVAHLMSTLLFDTVREEHSLAYAIGATTYDSVPGDGLINFEIGLNTSPENQDQVIQLIQNTLVAKAKEGFSQDEVDAVTDSWRSDYSNELNKASAFMDGFWLVNTYGVEPQDLANVDAIIPSVSAQDVNALMQKLAHQPTGAYWLVISP